jgi:hypothetical protein
MDRRKLIVGGSTVVAAATLLALGGPGIVPAADASDIDLESDPTTDHAQRVVNLVNADLGFVNAADLRSRFQESSAAYAPSSFPPGDGDPVPATGMEAWIGQRIVDLCGPDTTPEAAAGIPETRTLLSFGLAACSQHQPAQPPQIYVGMPVPPGLNALESDFFPVLLSQIYLRASDSPAFADTLRAGSDELDQLVNAAGSGGDGGPDVDRRRLTDTQIMALIVIAVVNLALFCTP